jgi:4-aminobutyrate aminotransferase-like enzyme
LKTNQKKGDVSSVIIEGIQVGGLDHIPQHFFQDLEKICGL